MLIVTVLAAVLLQAPTAPSEFEKRRALSEAVQGKRSASEGEVHQMIVDALADANPLVRRDALGILAAINQLSSLPSVATNMEWGPRLRPVAEALRPDVERMLDDRDVTVRRAALGAFVAAAAKSGGGPGQPLPVGVLRRLAIHFDKYPDGFSRGAIIMVIQSTYQSPEPDARTICLALLKKALEDPDPYVVQYAGHSATRAAAPEMLPLLVAQLKNPSHVARMGIAQGIASYGAAARPYLPQLQAALAAETDDITKKTIAGTISVINK